MAPHEMPISWAINVTELLYCISAIVALMAINTTINTLMQRTCFFSLMFFIKLSLRKSMVSVDDDVITSDDRVLILAESTSITTRPIIIGERVESISGIMAS